METDNSLVGQRFGRLTVKRLSGNDRGKRVWLCVCTCGRDTSAVTGDLRAGKVRSCGCIKSEAYARSFGLYRRRATGGTFAAEDAREVMLMDE